MGEAVTKRDVVDFFGLWKVAKPVVGGKAHEKACDGQDEHGVLPAHDVIEE